MLTTHQHQQLFYPSAGYNDNAFSRVFRAAKACGMVDRFEVHKPDGETEVTRVKLRDGFKAVAFTVVVDKNRDSENVVREELATNAVVLRNGNGIWHRLFEAAATRV